jgi:NAD(P)-dependent dehydrogenase (short-subunit alcohol dehydrogenase family)
MHSSANVSTSRNSSLMPRRTLSLTWPSTVCFSWVRSTSIASLADSWVESLPAATVELPVRQRRKGLKLGTLNGQVAIITGGASGIGAACCRLFVKEGARVVIADVQELCKELAEQLGEDAVYCRTDVSCEDDVRGVITCAITNFGRLDCMFNNAGVPGPSGPIEHVDAKDFDRAIGVLLRGVFFGIKHAAPILTGQKSGCIINTASVAGLQAGYGGHVYSAAKAGVIHLTRTVAMELGEHGVRVNCICPGAVATPIFGKELGLPDELANSTDRLTDSLKLSQPIPRACQPEDVANAAVWLAADAAGYVNGHALVIDGGMTGGLKWSVSQKRRQQLREVLTKAPEPTTNAVGRQ